jgi:hypothetical protein
MLRFVLLMFVLFPAQASAQTEVKEFTPRPGVKLKVLFAKAANPVASAVLFQGGGGNIGLFPNGSMRVEGFLSGNASAFVANDISVAIVDVPSDRSSLNDFRYTAEHAQDIAAVMAELRQQSALPVWAIGTSNGSLSAAAAALLVKDRPADGLVLTASTTVKRVSGNHPVTDAALEQVVQPTLFVHHKEDSCSATPYGAMPEVMARMKNARKVELLTIEGGEKRGNPCYSSLHQFLGIERDVIKKIADWIKAQQASPGAR